MPIYQEVSLPKRYQSMITARSEPIIRKRFVAKPTNKVIPNIVIEDLEVLCDGETIAIARKPLTFKLFKVFLDEPGRGFTRVELEAKIYGDKRGERLSDRFRQARQQNIVKLISRARLQANEITASSGIPSIDWFTYNPQNMRWYLYRLSPGYVTQSADKGWQRYLNS